MQPVSHFNPATGQFSPGGLNNSANPTIGEVGLKICGTADSPDTVGSFSTHHAQSTTTLEKSRRDIVKQYLVVDLLIFTVFSNASVSHSG